jgi:hypothetical protein
MKVGVGGSGGREAYVVEYRDHSGKGLPESWGPRKGFPKRGGGLPNEVPLLAALVPPPSDIVVRVCLSPVRRKVTGADPLRGGGALT